MVRTANQISLGGYEMGGTCGTYGGEERRGAYRVLVGKPEGKRKL